MKYYCQNCNKYIKPNYTEETNIYSCPNCKSEDLVKYHDQDMRIKVGSNDYMNDFKENKARKEVICYACKKTIQKGELKYSTREGHCHNKCAKKFQLRERNIAHEYSAFPKWKGEWIEV